MTAAPIGTSAFMVGDTRDEAHRRFVAELAAWQELHERAQEAQARP